MKAIPAFLMAAFVGTVGVIGGTFALAPTNSLQSSTRVDASLVAPIAFLNPLDVGMSRMVPLSGRTSFDVGHRSALFSQSQSAVSSSAAPLSRQTPSVLVRLRQWRTRFFFTVQCWIQNIMWKGTAPDSQHAEYSLPPGSFQCPLRRYGYSDIRKSTCQGGPGVFFKQHPVSLGYPRVWKGLTKSKDPFVVISGSSTVKSVLRQEFDTLQANKVIPFSSKIVGTHSIRFANDRKEHSFLRRLVGTGSSNEAVADAIPLLQQTAEDVVRGVILQGSNGTVVHMDAVCNEFTLNVAWRQILGLNLTEEEVPIFINHVQVWLTGLYDAEAMDESMASREYLVSLIMERVNELERDGPDDSTLGKMLFAVDLEADGDESSMIPRRLSRDQIIDNSLLLILAGSDTSAGTLTAALFSMGRHPSVWQQVVNEQRELIKQTDGNDEALTSFHLENMPYLDAVIKETMRIFPVIGGSSRVAKETIVVDGEYQIPKNWGVLYDRWLTHRQDPVTFQEDGSHMDPIHGFQPKRWLNIATCPGSEYIPFGAGPRYCLGAELAMAEMKVFLATLARNLDYKLVGSNHGDEAIKWKKESLFQVPADGVPVEIKARTLK